MVVTPGDLVKLSIDEKLALISELWDSIESSSAVPPLSELQQAELKRRRHEGLADPAATIDWPSARQELLKKP